MLEVALALVLLAGLATPHFQDLRRVSPRAAAAIWLLALALRALVSIGAAVFFFVFVPRTSLYDAVAQWCWHEALPVVSEILGFSGHALPHAAVILPAIALALSLLWLALGLLRGWLAVRRLIARALGEGPLGSTVVPDDRVVLAAAGLGRKRILVSAGALGALDERELAASLAHESGHLSRGHRPLMILGMALGALARPVPGTRAAERRLAFHLERDADEYAVRMTRDPLALASAICKAATCLSPVLVTLGGRGSTTSRVESLLERDGDHPETPPRGPVVALATLLTVLVLSLVATLLVWGLGPVLEAGAVVAETDLCHPH